MPIRVKNSSGFKNITSIKFKTNDGFKNVVKGLLKVQSNWRIFFESSLTPSIASPVEISKSTNAITKLITLTGTNYKWTNATSLSYEFNRSVPNTFDVTLDTDVITNPTVSNTKTYLLSATDVLPNQPNTFTFNVIAVNSQYNTAQSSEATTTVQGVRNITNLSNTIDDYDFLQFEWTGGQYSNSFIYQYQTYNSEVEGPWSEEVATVDTFAGLINLDSNTTYRIRVKGITGTDTFDQGYSGEWSYATGITASPPIPEVITYPSITGTGYAFTEINGTSGTYTSGTYVSKSAYIGYTTSAILPTSGSTTNSLSIEHSPPYNVTQYDASAPKRYFYYVDKVLANDNSTYYYYYSSQVDAKIGQVIDDYTRTVTGGLGVMTPSINTFMSPNAYTYNITANGSLWSVNGSAASIASAVSGSNPYTYPQQSVSLDGRTDAEVSASFPAGSDGLGLTFWSTNSGSWWASTVNRTASTVDKYVYYTLSTVCNTVGTVNDNYCSTGTETTYVCTPGAGTAGNNCGPNDPVCPENSSGDYITHCRTRLVSTCPDNGTGTSPGCKSRVSSTCPENNAGNSSVKCRTRSSQTCPNNGIGSTSSNCKTRSVSTCPANGTGNSIVNCGVTVTPTCPDNGSGSAPGCKSRVVSVQSCPNNGGGSTSSNCKTRTVTTYTCPSGYTNGNNGYCYGNFYPYPTIAATTVNTTVYDNYSYTNQTVYDQTVNVTRYDSTATSTVYDNYQTSTYYDATVSTTVYDETVSTTVYDLGYDNYPGNVPTTNTIYYIYGCTVGPVTQYGGTLPTNCSNVSSTATVYSTNIRTLNADGSNVTVVNTENIFSNEESPSTIGGMKVETSGNSISTTVYSDTSRSSAITTKTYTPSSPTKSSGSGVSGFGIIKTPPGSSGGTQFDDFNISPTN